MRVMDLDGATCQGCGRQLDGEHCVVLLSRPPRRMLLVACARLGCVMSGLQASVEDAVARALLGWRP